MQRSYLPYLKLWKQRRIFARGAALNTRDLRNCPNDVPFSLLLTYCFMVFRITKSHLNDYLWRPVATSFFFLHKSKTDDKKKSWNVGFKQYLPTVLRWHACRVEMRLTVPEKTSGQRIDWLPVVESWRARDTHACSYKRPREWGDPQCPLAKTLIPISQRQVHETKSCGHIEDARSSHL